MKKFEKLDTAEERRAKVGEGGGDDHHEDDHDFKVNDDADVERDENNYNEDNDYGL